MAISFPSGSIISINCNGTTYDFTPISNAVLEHTQFDRGIQKQSVLFGGLVFVAQESNNSAKTRAFTLSVFCTETTAISLISQIENVGMLKASLEIQSDSYDILISSVEYKRTLQWGGDKVQTTISGYILA